LPIEGQSCVNGTQEGGFVTLAYIIFYNPTFAWLTAKYSEPHFGLFVKGGEKQTEEAVMNKSDELKKHAENCADLAATSKKEQDKRRYKRMEEAYTSLAQTQSWLDGEKDKSRAEK
jgi:hypothetical protein